jgi:SPP1 gp7 family putative phage head morphogenesis protein
LTRQVIQGKKPDVAIKEMQKYVDSSMKNAKYYASRLVMTEQAFIASASTKDSFEALDVEMYEILATLDSKTSEVCQEMDGKVFPMKDFSIGATAPPFHVWCRTTTIPHFEDNFTGERIARGEDGKTYYVPDSMKYQDWKDCFVDHTKDPADFLKVIKTVEEVAEVKKTLKDIIQSIKDDIDANGGTITEDHIKQAGETVAEKFKKKIEKLESNYQEALKEFNVFTKQIDDINEKINKLQYGSDNIDPKNFDPFEALMRAVDNSEKYADEIDELSELKHKIISSKEYREAQSKYDKTVDALNGFSDYNSAQWLKDTLSEVREMGSDGLNVINHLNNSKSPMRQVVEDAYSFYPKDWVEKSIKRGNLTPKKVDRGYYSDWEQIIALSDRGGITSGSLQTAFHELGHRMEKAIPEILNAEKTFYNRRTANESLEWLGSGYSRNEKTRKDNFLDSYMGKDYGGTYYELVSMGFEYAYTNPRRLAQDPDMQVWIYGLLCLY